MMTVIVIARSHADSGGRRAGGIVRRVGAAARAGDPAFRRRRPWSANALLRAHAALVTAGVRRPDGNSREPLLIPLPLLFHAPFVHAIIVPALVR